MKRSKWAIGLLVMCLAAIMAVSGLTGCDKAEFSADKNITVVAREDGSGTKNAFMEIIGLTHKENGSTVLNADVPGVVIGSGTAAVMQEVLGNPHAIAYDSLGYSEKYDVKILKLNGVYPTVETVKDGSYAISRPLSIVYKPDTITSGANKAFYEFLISKTAQDIVASEGYIPMDATTPYTVDPNLSGEISVAGSTSLQPLMEKLAAKFETLQANVTITVSGGGSGTGLKNAENGVSDFGMISKAKKADDDAPSCSATEVARDGIAVIVNEKNPLDNITLEQLKNIYDSTAGANQIKVWNQLIH